MTKVVIDGIEATAENYKWQCNDAGLLELLNTLIDPLGAPSSAPDADEWLAQQAVERFKATITHRDKWEYDPSVVY